MPLTGFLKPAIALAGLALAGTAFAQHDTTISIANNWLYDCRAMADIELGQDEGFFLTLPTLRAQRALEWRGRQFTVRYDITHTFTLDLEAGDGPLVPANGRVSPVLRLAEVRGSDGPETLYAGFCEVGVSTCTGSQLLDVYGRTSSNTAQALDDEIVLWIWTDGDNGHTLRARFSPQRLIREIQSQCPNLGDG